jgi:hypothetical protein
MKDGGAVVCIQGCTATSSTVVVGTNLFNTLKVKENSSVTGALQVQNTPLPNNRQTYLW